LDILITPEQLDSLKISVRVDNLGMESRVNNKPNSEFKLIISVLAYIAEMERETMLKRKREGIGVAKAKGVYKGRMRGTRQN
jgi:DNA invertase Pin-like site-specific DNA recombinase